jgi:hypothetical protein
VPRSPGGEPTPMAVCSPPSRLSQDSNILRRNLTDGAERRQYIRHTRLERENAWWGRHIRRPQGGDQERTRGVGAACDAAEQG